jgi:TRAP-type C4-dicarboxylate transport system substrate-binding protein
MIRRFLFLLALLTLLPSGERAAAAASRPIKLATLVPEGSVWVKELKALAADARTQTGGRVDIRIYPGGIAGDDPDVVRKLRIGQLQAAALSVAGLQNIEPAFGVFAVPRFFASYEELYYVIQQMTPSYTAKLDKQGFVLLGWESAGWVNLFSSKPVHSPEDLKHLKMFVWAGDNKMTQWWKNNGYRPVPLSATDVMTGLTTGMIEALPTTPLYSLSLQWYRSAPYMLDLPMAPLIGATVVTKKAWAELSPADQGVLRDLNKRMQQRLGEAVPPQDKKAIDEMARRGLHVTHPETVEQSKAWEAAATTFAATMRREIVPEDAFDEATRIRDQYRVQHPPHP